MTDNLSFDIWAMLFYKVFNKTYLHDQISLMYSFFDK